MTTDEQRIFVCERLFGIKPPEPHQIAEGYSFQDWVDDLPPLTLDWLHECEKKLNDDNSQYGLVAYCNRLMKACGSHRACVSATAEQRLAALVETIKSTSPGAERKK